jgi:hypothetical protein
MTTATTRKVQIGSISSGTLRTEDLLEAFAWELSYLLDHEVHHTRSQRNLLAASASADLEANQGEGDALVDELIDALSELAPPLTYFGTLEGDGADFGFWPDWHQMLDERSINEGINGNARLMVDGKEWLPESELWLEVNDHGNVTVYADDDGQPGAEIWSVV